MTDKIFDNYIRDKIKDYPSPVPADMWDRIQQGKEKRRGLFWWKPLMSAIGLLAVGVVVWYLSDKSKGDFVGSAGRQVTINAGKQATTNKVPSTPSVQPPSHITDVASSPFASQLSAVTATSNNIAGTTEPATSLSAGAPVGNKLLAVFQKERVSRQKDGTKSARFVPGSRLSTAGLSASPPTAAEAATHGEDYSGLRYFLRPGVYSFSKQSSLTSLASPSKKSSFKIDCPRDVEPYAFYLEAFGSPDFVMKKMTSNRGAGDAYVRKKDSSETRELSFTYGIRFTKAVGENFVFKAGVQYSRINEKFTYRTEKERKQTTVVTTRTIINSQGQSVIVRDTSSYEQIGYSETTSHNQFNMVDIPLILGYEFGSEDMSFGMNGGILLNVTSWQRGQTINADYQPVAFNKNKDMEYKRSVGFGLYAGFSAIKKVAPRTSIFAEPYFRYNLSHFTNGNSLVNEKYHTAGILLGLRYKLTGGKATH